MCAKSFKGKCNPNQFSWYFSSVILQPCLPKILQSCKCWRFGGGTKLTKYWKGFFFVGTFLLPKYGLLEIFSVKGIEWGIFYASGP